MMKKYEEYKESGIERFGLVPKHWRVLKFKYVAKIKNGKDQKEVLIEEGGYPVLGTGGEFGRSSEYLYDKPSVLLGRKGTVDKPQFIEEPFWTVDTLFYTEINVEVVNPKFLFHISNFIPFEQLQESSAVPSMTQDKLHNVFFCIPSVDEQMKILEYLDHQTALIDALITKKEAMIEKLKLQRQAVINEAVTRGLDENVKLVVSGVEWLGEIPEGWEVVKLKYITEAYGRIGFRGYTNDDIVAEGEGAITISPSNIQGDLMRFDKNTYISWAKYDESPEIQIFNDDILMVKTGSTVGKVGLVSGLKEKATINPQLVVFKNLQLNYEFFYNLLRTTFFQAQVSINVIGSTIPTISQSKIMNMQIPVPSETEMNEVMLVIKKHNEIIDSLLTKIQFQITKLKLYRQSLISEAVTGKVDLREWK